MLQPHTGVQKLMRRFCNHLKAPRVASASDSYTPGAKEPMLTTVCSHQIQYSGLTLIHPIKRAEGNILYRLLLNVKLESYPEKRKC